MDVVFGHQLQFIGFLVVGVLLGLEAQISAEVAHNQTSSLDLSSLLMSSSVSSTVLESKLQSEAASLKTAAASEAKQQSSEEKAVDYSNVAMRLRKSDDR